MAKPLDDKTSVVLQFDKGWGRSHLQLCAHPQLADKYGIISSLGANPALASAFGHLGLSGLLGNIQIQDHHFVAIYALLCGEKMNPIFLSVEQK